MASLKVSLLIAVVTVAVTGIFIAYALSGADLCLWCRVVGR